MAFATDGVVTRIKDVGVSDIASASPRLGVTIYNTEYGLAAFGLSPQCEYPAGVLVGSIEANSSVYAAGLTLYDIITEFNGVKVTSNPELLAELAKYKAGQEISIKVFRFNRRMTGGEYVTLTFRLDATK